MTPLPAHMRGQGLTSLRVLEALFNRPQLRRLTQSIWLKSRYPVVAAGVVDWRVVTHPSSLIDVL